MSHETKATFFRQSGWLVIATAASGAFLVGVYPIFSRLPDAEIGIFVSLLRLFTVLGLATAGLQIVMAKDAAAAVTPEAERELARTVSSVAKGIMAVWLAIVLFCGLFRSQIIETLKISNPAALWVTLGLVLAQLCLPFAQGLLQGRQNFAWLGWSILMNGLGRFVAIGIAVILLKSHATGALAGALFGLGAAVLIGFWPSRNLFGRQNRGFKWGEWLRRAVPLSAGIGSVLFVMNADVLFVQSHFSEKQGPFYSAVAMVGVGLVTFTTPMAAVMFPKLVSSVARGQRTDSFILALAGTALLGLSGAIVCTLFPSLPLRIMFFNRPELWVSAQLVPWFMWGMLPVTLANVLIADLLAKQQFRVVIWLVIIAAAYGFAIDHYLDNVSKVDHFTAFKGVVLRLGIFSSLLLAIAAVYRLRQKQV